MEFYLLMGGKGNCVPEILSIGIQPEAVGWSFGNVFSFLSFGKTYYAGDCYVKTLPAFLKVIAAFEMIGGFILLFLLSLGLRNRFRLR